MQQVIFLLFVLAIFGGLLGFNFGKLSVEHVYQMAHAGRRWHEADDFGMLSRHSMSMAT